MSTLGVIESKMKKDNSVYDKLVSMLEKMKQKAKEEIEDFYAEVTYKRQRDKDAKRKVENEKKDKRDKKHRKEKSPTPEVEAPQDETEEQEESEEQEQDEEEDDEDIFQDRFAKGSVRSAVGITPQAGLAEGAAAQDVGGNFKKNLSTMLENATVLGALSQADWVCLKGSNVD